MIIGRFFGGFPYSMSGFYTLISGMGSHCRAGIFSPLSRLWFRNVQINTFIPLIPVIPEHRVIEASIR